METNCSLDKDDPEVKQVKACCTMTTDSGMWDETSQKFSDYYKLLRAVAHVRKMGQQKSWKIMDVGTSDLQKAEQIIHRDVQRQFYEAEIEAISRCKQTSRGSKLLALDPKMDEDKVLRIGGRVKKSLALIIQREASNNST